MLGDFMEQDNILNFQICNFLFKTTNKHFVDLNKEEIILFVKFSLHH